MASPLGILGPEAASARKGHAGSLSTTGLRHHTFRCGHRAAGGIPHDPVPWDERAPMIRLQTALAALAALLMTLSVLLAGGAQAQSNHNKAHHAFLGVMDDALVGPERPVWTRTQSECGDGDTIDAATATQPPASDTLPMVWSAPRAVVGFQRVLTALPPARGPPIAGT
jgi:hypothetical protein